MMDREIVEFRALRLRQLGKRVRLDGGFVPYAMGNHSEWENTVNEWRGNVRLVPAADINKIKMGRLATVWDVILWIYDGRPGWQSDYTIALALGSGYRRREVPVMKPISSWHCILTTMPVVDAKGMLLNGQIDRVLVVTGL